MAEYFIKDDYQIIHSGTREEMEQAFDVMTTDKEDY